VHSSNVVPVDVWRTCSNLATCSGLENRVLIRKDTVPVHLSNVVPVDVWRTCSNLATCSGLENQTETENS